MYEALTLLASRILECWPQILRFQNVVQRLQHFSVVQRAGHVSSPADPVTMQNLSLVVGIAGDVDRFCRLRPTQKPGDEADSELCACGSALVLRHFTILRYTILRYWSLCTRKNSARKPCGARSSRRTPASTIIACCFYSGECGTIVLRTNRFRFELLVRAARGRPGIAWCLAYPPVPQ